jgi:hypothetical protein
LASVDQSQKHLFLDDEDEEDERSLGRLFQSAYTLNPPDAAGGPGCSVGYVAAANGASQAASGLDHHLPVSIDLDNDPLSRLFAESDHDDDDDVEIGLNGSFARAVAGTEQSERWFETG